MTTQLSYAQLAGYSERLKGVVNSSQVSGTSDLTNFPVLMSFTVPQLRHTSSGGSVQNINGYDIVFTTGNGSTIMSHEIETYDPTTGQIEFWVRFPTLSATSDTPFYIYFGNPSVSTDPSSPNVWDSNYKMVLHMNGDTNDSSGEGTDATDSGTTDVAGQIGRAREYGNNQGDVIFVPDNGVSPLDITGNITISFWVNISNLIDGPDFVTKGDYTDGYSTWVTGGIFSSGRLVYQINNDALQGSSTGQISNGTWSYLTFTRSPTERRIYIDGVLDVFDNSTASFNTNDDPLYISTPSFDFEGIMDEVRISDVTRSADWIATEYNNQSNPGAFVSQVNAEPILDNIEASAITYNSGDPATAITSAITVYDGDDTDIQSATVQITGNYISTEDVLAFTNQNGITGSWDAGTGTLTLTGTSSKANYQAALRSITYENTNPAPSELTRTVSFTINDGNDDSNTETRNINVVKVNIAPSLSNIESSSIVYFAGNGEKAITNTLNLSDADDTNLVGATVQISVNYLSSEDTLKFVDQNGITGSWNDGTGTLTLSGTSTVANYKAALRSVVYENTSGSPSMNTRTISITASDATEAGNTVTRDIEFPASITELATYKSNGVFHFDAQDADGDGNPSTNQPPDGALNTWGDRSDNVGASTVDLSFAANAAAEEALLGASYLGGRGGLLFDGTDDYYERTTDDAILNTGTFTEKSFAFVIRTGASTSGFQVFYEQGGGTRGYNFSVFDGVLYAHAYNRSGGSAWGAPDGGHRPLNLGTVEPNTTYIIIANHNNSIWEASVNGGPIVQVTNANTMTSHTGNAAIGAADANTRDPITFSNTSGVPFNGFITELVSWNSALTPTDFTNIYGFLSDKWFNEAPVIAGIESSDISYSEGDPATQITNSITVSDADDTNLDSAKVYISSGFDASEDVLAFTNQLGITGVYNSSTGVLLLTGSSSVANYQTALRAVTYQNTDAVSPSTTQREITFEVYDWDDVSNTVVRNINILPSNTAPVLSSIEGSTLAYTETDGQVPVTSSITISDTDNTNLAGATVRFTNNYFLGEDYLDFTNANGISGSFNSSTGVLTLSGSSSVANYQTALRNVTYENTSEDPVAGLNRTVEFRVFDGIDSSGVQTRDISVTSINTPPTLANIESATIFYSAGDSVIVTDQTTISDPDDLNIETVMFQITGNYDSTEDTLTFNSVFGINASWNDVTGTLTLTGPAAKIDFESAIQTVRYKNTATTPTDIPRTISITANDGDDNSNTVTRTISFSIPASVSNLLVWLKGDAGTFTTTGGTTPSTEGSNVGRWEDQSGNGNHFTATSGTPPVFRTSVGTINNQNAIEFPGGGTVSRLEDADAETQYLNGLGELTIFFVLESDAVGTDRGFWTTYQPDATGTDQYFSMRYDAIGDNGGATNVITTGMRDLSPPTFVMESFENAQSTSGQIVMLKWKSQDTYDLYVDGVLSNPTHSTNIPTGILSNLTTAIIGQGTKDQNNSWDGLIAEVILYGKELNTTEQRDIEDYLSNKYGIAIRSLTPATGGEAISADSAAVVGGGYVTLTGPRIQESFVGEFTNGGTFVFKAPSGYEWDTGGTAPSATVNPAFGGSTDLTINFTSRTSTEITFTVSSASTTNPAEVIFNNLRVKPTTGVLPNTGTITNIGTTGLGGTTNYGTLTMVPGTQIAMEYLQQPSTSNVSSAITPYPRIQLVDQFGNAVNKTGVTINMSLNQVSGTGNLSGTTSVQTNLFGIAEFNNLQIDDTGTYTLTASSTGLSSEISNQFDIVVLGQLTEFIVQRVPSGNIANKTAGQNFNITVIAVDGAADTVDTFTGTVSLTSNCTMGTGQGTTPAFTGGVLASRTVSITNTGTCSITATNSAGPETGTSNTFTVTPGAPSAATTTISASPTVIFNDGFSTSTITVQVKDAEGNNVTSGGQTVVLNVTDGSLSAVTDNNDGSYTATLTSSIIAGVATITGTLNGTSITDNATVEYAEFNTQWQSQVGPVVDAQNWDDPANWSAGIVPGPTDKVLIPANPSVGNEQPVVKTTNTTVAQIALENSASVTVSGGINFVVTGEVSGGGTINGSNVDTLTVGGTLDVDATIGYVILNGSSAQTVNNPTDFSNLELNNPSGAVFSDDVIVSDSLKLTNGELFIPSGKNLIANAQYYGSGNLRMQRRISGSRGWRIISSPVNTTYGDLLDGVLTQGYSGANYSTGSIPGDTLQPNVLTYLESAPGTDNQRYRAPSSASQMVSQGQGIFVYIFGDIAADPLYNDPIPDTLDVTGQEWDGNGTEVDFGVTYTVTADSGWNLIGNPFAATIDWDDNANWTKTNIDPTIYIWDPSANGGNGEYLTWNGVTGTLPGGLIAPFQGFWVKANASSPVLRVNKAAKTTAGSFRRKQSENTKNEAQSSDPQIQLLVRSDAGRSKRTNIMFSDVGSKNKDALDAYRLLPLSNSHIELHTLLDDGTELAINNLPLTFNSRVKIPLHIDAFENGAPYSGDFELMWPGLRNIPSDWIITLIDNETGEEIDIRTTNSYTFSHTTRNKISKAKSNTPNAKIYKKAASTDTRFTLEISTEYIEANVPEEVYLSQNYPNPFNPETKIPFGLDEDSNVELAVYDVLGRKVRTLISGRRTAGNYEVPFKALDLASGVYFYRLVTDKATFIKKFTLIK